MSDEVEGDLVARAQAGDRDAFGEIVRIHQQAVFNVAYRMLGSVPDAEDALQEAFLRAYRFLAGFDRARPLGPWLKRIAANVCLSQLEQSEAAPPLDENLTPDPGPGPEPLAERRGRDDRLRGELLRLPARYRLVIELRHFQQLSYVEIARELKRPLSDVKSDLFRARKMLAERLRDLQ